MMNLDYISECQEAERESAVWKIGDRAQFNKGTEIVSGTYEGAHKLGGFWSARVLSDDGTLWLTTFSELSREAVTPARLHPLEQPSIPPQAQYSTLHREEFERWQKSFTTGSVTHRVTVRREWQADFDRAMRRAKLRRLHESAEAALSTVMPSDVAGMARMSEPAPVVQPDPASTTKAACVGLGVVWSGRGGIRRTLCAREHG